ncbi:MAG: hypothetical protein ACP5CD_07135, partial [Thermovirgaceae bacterium]
SFCGVLQMFFYWKTGPEGELWISRAALKDGLRNVLPGEFECADVSFSGSDSEVTLAIVARNPEDDGERESLVEDLRGFFRPLGIDRVRVNWARQAPLSEHPAMRTVLESWVSSPLTWGLFVGGLAVVFQLGARGTLVALLWGLFGFFASSLFLLERGRKILRSVTKLFRKKG